MTSTWISGSKIIAGFVLHNGDLSWFNRSISSFVTILVAKNTHSLDSSDTCKKTQRHKDTGNRGFSLGGKQQLLPAKLLSAAPGLAGQVLGHLEKILLSYFTATQNSKHRRNFVSGLSYITIIRYQATLERF